MRTRGVAVAILLLGVVGCGKDPVVQKEKPDPEATVSTSPSQSAPAMPEGAKTNTKAGAVEFVKHYVDLINYAQATGDVEALRRVEAESCGSCSKGRQYLSGVYGKGGRIEGGSISVKVIDALPNHALEGWAVDGRLDYGPQDIFESNSDPSAQHLKGGFTVATFQVTSRSGVWIMGDWTRSR